MQPDYQSHFRVPQRSEVPFETWQAVLEQQAAEQQAAVKRLGEEARTLNDAQEELQAQTIAALGGEAYERFRRYMAEQRRCRAKMLFPPHGPEMTADELERLRRAWKHEARVELEKIGIKASILDELRSRTLKALIANGLMPPLRNGHRAGVLRPWEVPEEVPDRENNPWVVVTPPFAGGAWWYRAHLAGFSFIPTLFLDHVAGFIGNVNFVRDSDAGGADFAHAKYSSGVNFWFQMPVTGLVEAVVEATSNSARHHLTLIDEYGVSNASVSQHSYLTLKASAGGSESEPPLAEMSWMKRQDASQGYWDHQFLTRGDTYSAYLRSDPRMIIPAGAWVLVEVACLNFNAAFANDVEVYSNMDFSWSIRSVRLRSTGM